MESRADIRRMEVRELAKRMISDPRLAETLVGLKQSVYPSSACIGTNYDYYLLMTIPDAELE